MSILTALGKAIPAGEAHAVSVSLPTWRDVTGYEEGESRVIDAMQIGYPRFFVHLSIKRLAEWCIAHYGREGETCYLFPSLRTSQGCVDFLQSKTPSLSSRLSPVSFHDKQTKTAECPSSDFTIFAVFMPIEHSPAGKEYWQHTGDGISSRLAERCLQTMEESSNDKENARPDRPVPVSSRGFGRNKHYSRASNHNLEPVTNGATPKEDGPECDASVYLEERYGRNLTKTLAPLAKTALKRRIAGVLSDQPDANQNQPPSKASPRFSLRHLSLEQERETFFSLPENTASTRGSQNLSQDDVYLYPTGMSAIFHAHLAVQNSVKRAGRPAGKSVCFGFPYTDTLKILQKWGAGCHHFGHGTEDDLDKLEALLDEQERSKTADRIVALHTEFPSNPLLRSADLQRLRQLADKHGFIIVVDETIGTFANVEVLPYVDIAVSSLTKIFSGDANVMGGSLVLNPDKPYYASLKATLAGDYEDNMFEDDAVFVERNSRDYKDRIVRIDRSTEALCDFLRQRLEIELKLATISFPKFTTPENYARCLRKHDTAQGGQQPGYGGLFSVVFHDQPTAQAFFDNLGCEKGPSLGTNFTLACPYTILAHYNELEWTRQWGVSDNLVRVSVGLEPFETLRASFDLAIKACEQLTS